MSDPRPVKHVVSLSGGKDSTATLLLALELHGKESVQAVFADTGNEHELTYKYALEYLPSVLGIQVDVVRADFSYEFAVKRANLARIAAGEPESSVYGGRKFKYPWTPEAAAKALEYLHPTGNPFLDLCMVRGGFPSRKRQFCTEYLKTLPLTEYQLGLIDQGYFVESWQGVRADESEARRWLLPYEYLGGFLGVNRPILRWNVNDVFEAHRIGGIEPNPLYRQGFSRVGCMPCINCDKAGVRATSLSAPEHIEKVDKWERLVSLVCRPGSPVSFFHMGTQGHKGQATTIHQIVEWSKTSRGGKQFDMFFVNPEPTACASAYGLCE